MKRRLRAPSPALVIALIALFVALGGSSYAAINSLPKNSVGSKQLKNNAVTGSKIKNGAVTAGKINTSGLTVPNATHATSSDSATNATNATHATSATTATSATSATNATNAAVAASLKGVQYVVSSAITNGASSQNTDTEVCPAGTFVVAGGAFGSSGGTTQAINSSLPITSGGATAPNAWRVDMNNSGASAATFNVYAICAPLTNPTGP
jgi:hypothetical protein